MSYTVTSIDVGDRFSCAVLSTGAVRCWGLNSSGQLGYANAWDVPNVLSPSDAGDVVLGGTAVSVSVGNFACALMTGGGVRCWGANSSGQLGYGHTRTIGDDETPASVGDVPVGGIAVAISVGGAHACALMSTGAVRCWGSNGYGQLGYQGSSVGDNETPASVGDVPLGGTAIAISAGGSHTCALMTAGTVRCWGRNIYGELGYGNTNSVSSPRTAGDVPLGGTAISIATGDNGTTCAVMSTGGLRCWGYAYHYQLGYRLSIDNGAIGDNETPADMGDIPLGDHAQVVAIGGFHTCVLLVGGTVRCWGLGDWGLLGTGSTAHVRTAQESSVVDLGGTATTIFVSGSHTCVTLSTGSARCWGLNQQGELGYGSKVSVGDNESPSVAGDVLFEKVVQSSSTGVSTSSPVGSSTSSPVGSSTSSPVGSSTSSPVGSSTSPYNYGAPITTSTLVSSVVTRTENSRTQVVTLRVSGLISRQSIATFAKLKVLSTSKVSLKVVSSYAKYCKVSGTALKGLRTGSCKVTVTVTPKKGKATSKTVTLKVSK
jgi:alpha-tubulin suppressor-like RCC1 family protein